METLKEKLGPLPVYMWLILLTVAGGAWLLLSRRKQVASQPTPAAAANDVPQTVIQTPVTINQAQGDEDTDRERQRTRKAQKHKCPAGHHFEAGAPHPKGTPGGGLVPPEWVKVPGGYCVPDDDKGNGTIKPIPVNLPNPRIPPAGRQPTNHEPVGASPPRPGG